MMSKAKAGGYAVGFFESWSIDSLQGAIDAAEQMRAPTIVGFNGEMLSRSGRVTRERHVIQLTKIHDLTVDLTGCASQQDVRDHVQAQVAGLEGLARVTLVGTLATQVDLRPRELSETPSALDALTVRASAELCVAYDYDEIEKEPTVRGAFVRDVRAAGDLSEEERRAVLVTGLRAFEGRDDLEAL